MKNSQNHWCNGDIVVIYTIAWKSQWISMFIWYKWMKNAHEMLMDFSQTAQHGIQWTTVYFACTLRKWTIFLWTCIKYGRGINSHRIYVSNECAYFFFANWKCWHFFFVLFIYFESNGFHHSRIYQSHLANLLHWTYRLLFIFFISVYPIHECCYSNTMTYMNTIVLIVWEKTMFTVRQHFVTVAYRWLNWHWDNMRSRWISCKTNARWEKHTRNIFKIDDVFVEIVIQ